LRIVSLLLLVALIGGGFVWWQDQATLRGKEPTNLGMEHVEVESADGTTQIHPLDEPEDQAVAEAQNNTAPLPLNNAEPAAPAPVTPATPTATAPVAGTAVPAPAHGTPATPAAPAHSTPTTPATAATPAPTPAPAPVEAAPAPAGFGQVQIQFTADCWFQITDGNGKVLTSGLKRTGDSVNVSGKPPLAVRLGVARAAQVSYNGQPVDVTPFTSGQTARMKLGQ
jgi:cytoskeleton protein RodZ